MDYVKVIEWFVGVIFVVVFFGGWGVSVIVSWGVGDVVGWVVIGGDGYGINSLGVGVGFSVDGCVVVNGGGVNCYLVEIGLGEYLVGMYVGWLFDGDCVRYGVWIIVE